MFVNVKLCVVNCKNLALIVAEVSTMFVALKFENDFGVMQHLFLIKPNVELAQCENGCVVQWITLVTTNPGVAGSIPRSSQIFVSSIK